MTKMSLACKLKALSVRSQESKQMSNMGGDWRMDHYYPVFLNIRGKRCVVVGGGEVALRKVKALLECGANVTVVSPALCLELS